MAEGSAMMLAWDSFGKNIPIKVIDHRRKVKMNMKHPKQLVTVLLMGAACTMQAQRSEALLEKNWKFSKGDFKEASQPEFNDT